MQEKLRCSEETTTDLAGGLSQCDGSCDILRETQISQFFRYDMDI